MKNTRRHFRPDEKVKILKLCLLDRKPISDICGEYGLNPTVFYRWQKQFFEQGAAAFERNKSGSSDRKLEKENARLKARLSYKDEKEECSRKWMHELIQGKIDKSDLLPVYSNYLESSELQQLTAYIMTRPLRIRNRAVFVLAYLKGIPIPTISRFLLIPRQTAYLWTQVYEARLKTSVL